MQANGHRVVTMFLSREELSRCHVAPLKYMSGSRLHSRDPCSFLLHDLAHMEHFCDKDTHLEQVGFFRCLLRLERAMQGQQHGVGVGCFDPRTTGSRGGLKLFFIGPLQQQQPTLGDAAGPHNCDSDCGGYDEQLWGELEYVISDM